MQDIEKNIELLAPIEKVWAALTDPRILDKWMSYDGASKVELSAGGCYAFFGGDTTGVFTRIEKPNLLEYTWRMAEWDRDWPDSGVRWELVLHYRQHARQTNIRLVHSNLPNQQERGSHDEGWEIYFLEPLKEMVESWTFGART